MGVVARRQGSDWPVWSTHDARDEPLLDGSEYGLENGRLDEPGTLPMGDHRLSETER